MKKGKEQILEFMRRSSYAPLTAEDLIEEIPITDNLNNFWQDLKELQENGEIIKNTFRHIRFTGAHGACSWALSAYKQGLWLCYSR